MRDDGDRRRSRVRTEVIGSECSESRAFKAPGVQSTDFSRLPVILNGAHSKYRALEQRGFRVPTLVGSQSYSAARIQSTGRSEYRL